MARRDPVRGRARNLCAGLAEVARSAAIALLMASCRGGTEPDAAGPGPLEPLPAVDLGVLDATAQTQVAAACRELEQMRARPGAGARELGEAFGRLGWLFHAYEMRDAAAPCYRNAERLVPTAFAWPYSLGCLYAARGEHEQAVAAHDRALALDPDYVPAHLALGQLWLDANELDRAQTHYARAHALDPACAAALVGLGMVASARQDPAAAVDHLVHALALQPQASAIHYPLAMAYRALGQLEQAQEHLARRGDDPPIVRDPVLAQMAALPAGIRHLEKRGVESGRSGQLDAAVRDLRQAVAADPGSTSIRLNLGTALALSGAIDEAIAEYREALRLAPEAPQAHYNLATLLRQQGRGEEALEHFGRAVALDPDYTDAYLGLAEIEASQGDQGAAAAHYARAIELDPRHRAARLGHAIALARAGRHAESRAALEEARLVLPDSMLLAHALARLLASCPEAALRDGPRALELALAAFQVRGSAEHAETVAMAYAELGNRDEAVSWQRQALARGAAPDRAGIEARLALYEQGQACREPWPPLPPLAEAPAGAGPAPLP